VTVRSNPTLETIPLMEQSRLIHPLSDVITKTNNKQILITYKSEFRKHILKLHVVNKVIQPKTLSEEDIFLNS
jgi:hypothetical protein